MPRMLSEYVIVLLLILIFSPFVYRVTRFIVDDTIIEEQRTWVMKKLTRHDPPMVTEATPKWRKKLVDLLECPYCVSFYVTVALVLVECFVWSVPQPVVVAGATCGGCMVYWKVIES